MKSLVKVAMLPQFSHHIKLIKIINNLVNIEDPPSHMHTITTCTAALDSSTRCACFRCFAPFRGDDCHTVIAMVSVSHSRRKLLQVSGVTTDINTLSLWLQM